MVCISCIVVPFVLWVFHKFIQPFLGKYIPWFKKAQIEDSQNDSSKIKSCPIGFGSKESNGAIPHTEVTAGDSGGDTDKKSN